MRLEVNERSSCPCHHGGQQCHNTTWALISTASFHFLPMLKSVPCHSSRAAWALAGQEHTLLMLWEVGMGILALALWECRQKEGRRETGCWAVLVIWGDHGGGGGQWQTQELLHQAKVQAQRFTLLPRSTSIPAKIEVSPNSSSNCVWLTVLTVRIKYNRSRAIVKTCLFGVFFFFAFLFNYFFLKIVLTQA